MIGAVMQVSPSQRVVPTEDLLVSTTDTRGVITGANTALARISGYLPRELVGEPHSLLRHPDLPAGLYRSIWQRLAADRPAAAYLTNRSRDGLDYEVFAVIVPVRAGYLSLQMAPAAPQVEIARRLHRRAGDLERRLAAAGRLHHTEIAAAGAREIERLLLEQGIAGFDALQATALAAEVAGRTRVVDRTADRRPGTPPLADVVAGIDQVHRDLGRLMDWAEVHQQLSRRLDGVGTSALRTAADLHRAVDTARAASHQVAGASPALVNVAAMMEPLMSRAVEALRDLSPALDRLREDVAGLTEQLALAWLQAEAVAVGVVAVHDGTAPASSLRDLPHLCDTVDAAITAVGVRQERVNAALTAVTDRVEEAGDMLGRFRTFLGQWRILVLRRRQGRVVADHLGLIDAELDATSAQLDDLAHLASECLDAVRPFDRGRLDHAVRRVRAGLTPAQTTARGVLTLPSAPRVPCLTGGPARVPMPIWPGEPTSGDVRR